MHGSTSIETFPVVARKQLEEDSPVSSQFASPPGQNQIPSGTGYLALSYCAGDANDTVLIKVDGHDFKVFRNLFTALRQFRSMIPESVTIQAWIDQICIDQSNVEERGHQVAMMADIYKCAKETWIWLGPNNSEINARKVLGPFFRMVARDFFKNLSNSGAMDDGLPSIDACADLNKGFLQERSEEYIGLKHFTDSRWWNRCWVYQEAILAQAAIFLFGDFVIQREILCLVYMELVRFTSGHFIHSRPRNSFGRWISIADMASKLHFFNTYISVLKDGLLDLPTALTLARGSDSSDPRDRVYSMLGLLRIDYGITPDYASTTSAGQVFTMATKKIIERHNTLNILTRAFAHTYNPLLKLPSWVPDFSSPEALNRPLQPDERPQILSTTAAHEFELYVPRFFEDCFENSILECSVIPLGRLANHQNCISNPPTARHESQTPETVEMDLLNSFQENVSNCINQGGLSGLYEPTGERIEDLLASSLGSGTLSARHQSFDASNTVRPVACTTTCLSQGVHDGFLSAFVTPNHLFGLARGGVRADDLLVILIPADVPFIIRRADPCVGEQHHDLPQNEGYANYTLVCHAYLHGVDFAEMLQDVRRRSWEQEVRRIRLC